MRSTLTQKSVADLKSAEKPYEVRDQRFKGLLLRVQPSGVKSYVVEYGRGKRKTLGRADVLTPAAAREAAKKVQFQIHQGEDPHHARKNAETLGSFLDQVYAPWAKSSHRSPEVTLHRLKTDFRKFRSIKLVDLNYRRLDHWRTQELARGSKPSTINRKLADLKALLSRAVEWGYLKEHPLAKLKRLKVDERGKVRFLDSSEEGRLRKALDDRQLQIREARESANKWREKRGYPLLEDLSSLEYVDHLKPLVILALNTGMRRGELFGLEWDDVDLERATLTIVGDRAKSGSTRYIPLNSEALSVLEVYWRQTADDNPALVFPGRHGSRLDNIRKSWSRLLDLARIDNFRFHDLRHHFASKLVMAGVDLNTVRELLGHSDYKMTLRYAHLAPEHKLQAVEMLMKS
ncbi:MAG: tyrosine-type recombinase/integrase [Phycisphaerales bacterium]|nr:tyrosine-type recombinase/integrase [Phycisphaerales bacterium]